MLKLFPASIEQIIHRYEIDFSCLQIASSCINFIESEEKEMEPVGYDMWTVSYPNSRGLNSLMQHKLFTSINIISYEKHIKRYPGSSSCMYPYCALFQYYLEQDVNYNPANYCTPEKIPLLSYFH